MYNIYAIVILILLDIPRFSVNDLHQIQVAAPSPSSIPMDNLSKTDIVERKLSKELHMGRIAGPFVSPPFHNYQSSPLGVVPKKEPNEFRIIHDLSYPVGSAVNEYIPKEFTMVHYETLDHVISLLSHFGRGALIGKTDIEDAFRIIPIHPSCYHLFGFTWESHFYYDRCLPMGCAETCRIFKRFSCALQWIVQTRGALAVSHILDDFIFIGPPNSLTCFHDLNKFIVLSEELSIPMKHQKTCQPSTCITVHGIELDTINWEARLPGDKVKNMQSATEGIRKCRSISLRQLQSVIGLLNFACKVISPGRAFLRRLINLTIGISKPSHHVRLNSKARADLAEWHCFLSSYNDVTMLISKPSHHIRLNSEARADLAAWHCFLSSYNDVTMLINSKLISSESIKLYTDAASTQGFAAVFGSVV